MLRRGLVSVVLALVAGSASLSAAAVTARPVSYGIAATRICLTKHGAVFGAASDPAVAALPAAQRRKVLDGLLPPGTVHLFLVIGTTAADAESLRARIAATVEFKPTATNSRAGRLGNAAWFVVSLGSRPSLALMKTVSGCLESGPVTPPLAALTKAGVSSCVGLHSGDIVGSREQRVLFPPLPAAVSDHLLVALVPGDNTGSGQGVFAFVLFGSSAQKSIALRARLVTALAGHLGGAVMGKGRAAAWLTIPTGRASSSQVRAARRTFGDCAG